MSSPCKHCGGTGKTRTIAVVGEPQPTEQAAAREKILGAAHSGDHVVCFTDFAQMVCAGASLSHTRERDKKLDELTNIDDVVDVAPAPKPLPTRKAESAPVESASRASLSGPPPIKEDEPKARRSIFTGKKNE